MPDQRTQLDKFEQAARELGADEDEARWDERKEDRGGETKTRETGVNRQITAQLAALVLLVAFVGWWGWRIAERGDVVGLIAPLGFAAIVLQIWKPWWTLRGL